MLRDDDDRGMTISQWRKTIERDRAAQARPVVIAFFSPETFREWLATLDPPDADEQPEKPDDSDEFRFA